MQKRILLIDDEDSLRRSLSLGLKQKGYEVEPCENGVCALKKLEQYHSNKIQFDGIVLDIKLPDIDGITLSKMIGTKFPGILIFLITGFMERYNNETVQSLQIQSLIEKPFTAEELSIQIENAIQTKKTIAPKPTLEVGEKTETSKSVSAYALIKLKENIDFMDVYKKLYFHENTVYCDTTNGDYDIIMLLQGEHIDACQKVCEYEIKAMKEVESVELMEITKPILDETSQKILDDMDMSKSKGKGGLQKTRDLSKGINSYILLEVEKEKLDNLYTVFNLNEHIIFCDYTTGKYNLVLFVHGNHFNQIDQFVAEKIMTLDGILKMKEFPVVNLIGM